MRGKATPSCRAGARSPLADRAGYIPRCVTRGAWCVRECLGQCGEWTANDDGRCLVCRADLLREFGYADARELAFIANFPFGECRRRGAA